MRAAESFYNSMVADGDTPRRHAGSASSIAVTGRW
jgi:hypothetical protein